MTGRRNVLEGLIWKRQAAVMGSGMSGGERGSRQGCNAQTHTHIVRCAQVHTFEPAHTHKHMAMLVR